VINKTSAIFLDRDGVINVHRTGYVKSWQDFKFLPRVLTAFRRLDEMPYAVIVVSNQSVVGRGLATKHVVDGIHHRMMKEIRSNGGRIDEVVYCPHRPEEHCTCRKPSPEMLLQVSSENNLDIASSFFIGDSPSDVEAAVAAGCTPVLVLTGRGKTSENQITRQYPGLIVVQDLLAAVLWIGDQKQHWDTE
jgi:histidinol-phosphate phosphatase family protein